MTKFKFQRKPHRLRKSYLQYLRGSTVSTEHRHPDQALTQNGQDPISRELFGKPLSMVHHKIKIWPVLHKPSCAVGKAIGSCTRAIQHIRSIAWNSWI